MKRNLLWFFGLAIMAATSFSIVSCDPDACKDVNCGTDGACVEGTCVCDQGFEGTNCDVTWGAKYVGTWKANDVCNGTSGTNLVVPEYSPIVSEVSSTRITIKNFGGFNIAQEVSFDLATANTITIDGTDNGGRKFSAGIATLGDNGKITYTYKVTYSDGTFDDCTGTMSK